MSQIINKNLESNKDKIFELYKEYLTIRRAIRRRKKKNKDYNYLSLRISELKKAFSHYKNDTIMLNNRILEFKSLKDNMEQFIDEIELLEHRIEMVNNKINNTTNKKQLEV